MLENLEKMAKEMGLSKSAMISVALENYKERSSKIKKPSWQAGFWIYYTWVNYTCMAKEKARYFTFLLIPIQFQKIGK